MHLFQVSRQCAALCRREHVADIGHELHKAFGSLICQLQVRDARSFQRSPIDRARGEPCDGLRVRGLQLGMQRQQIVHRLLHQRRDLRLLCIGGIDLNIQVLQHVIDVRIDVCRAVSAAHAVMPTAHAGSVREGGDAADQGGTGDDESERHAAKERTAGRFGFHGSIHNGYLIGE